jgi:hypothetical protein
MELEGFGTSILLFLHQYFRHGKGDLALPVSLLTSMVNILDIVAVGDRGMLDFGV